MNKSISIIVILVVIVAGFMLWKGKSVAPTTEEQISNDQQQTTPTPSAVGTVKELIVEGGNFFFAPKTLTVNVGDTVKITFNNSGGLHDLKIDEFNVATKVLQNGQSETITFVATKAGTFEYYCSVGQHRQMGMVGTLTVK